MSDVWKDLLINAWSPTTYEGFAFAKPATVPSSHESVLKNELGHCPALSSSHLQNEHSHSVRTCSISRLIAQWLTRKITCLEKLNEVWLREDQNEEAACVLIHHWLTSGGPAVPGEHLELSLEKRKKEPSSKDESQREGRRGSEEEKLKTSTSLFDLPFVFWRAVT